MRCYGDGTARNAAAVLFAYNERPRFAAAVEPGFTGPAELEIRLQSSYSGIEPPVFARMSLLPLHSASGMIDRAIGAFVAKGPFNHAPYRFEIERTEVLPLDARQAEARGPSRAHRGVMSHPTKVPLLRVVEGGRPN